MGNTTSRSKNTHASCCSTQQTKTHTLAAKVLTRLSNLFAASSGNQTNAAVNAGNTCCLAPMLGDTSKAADMTSRTCHDHHSMSSGLSIATGYITAGATLASLKTTVINQLHVMTYQDVIQQLENEKNTQQEDSSVYEGLLSYLKTQKDDVTFLRNIPGVMSAVASALIGIGMFTVWPVSLAGLALGVVDGAFHLYKAGALAQRYSVNIANTPCFTLQPDATSKVDGINAGVEEGKKAALEFLQQEKKLCYGRALGAFLTIVGVACFVLASLAMNLMILGGMQTGLLIAGAACLLPAIYVSIRFNAYQDMGLREKEKSDILYYQKRPRNGVFEDILKDLRKDKSYVALGKEYLKIYTKKQSIPNRLWDSAQIALGEFLTLISFNLPESLLQRLNRSVKERIADSAATVCTDADRVLILQGLAAAEEDQDPLKEDMPFVQQLTRSPIAGWVFQLLAQQALGSDEQLKAQFTRFYKTDIDKHAAAGLLEELKNTAPCCIPTYHHSVYEILLPTDADLRQEFEDIIRKRFDQYALFSLPNLSQKAGRIHSRLLGSLLPYAQRA